MEKFLRPGRAVARTCLLGLRLVGAGLPGLSNLLWRAPWSLAARTGAAAPKQIKAFYIDFNWVHSEPRPGAAASTEPATTFALPGHWAGASPAEQVRWYEYVDYLSRSIADALQKTGMDGTMIDWVDRDGSLDCVYLASTNGFWNDGDSLILGTVARKA